MATPQHKFRIPQPRWEAAIARARAGRTDVSKVVNSMLVLYLRGELDEALAPLLDPGGTSAAAPGQGSLPSWWPIGHSPSAAISAT